MSCGISGEIFGLFLLFLVKDSFRWFWIRSLEKNAVNAGVPQGSILGPTPFLLHINNLPNDVICNITIYADETTLYS